MNLTVQIPLVTSAEQHARLVALQAAFAQVCNALAPMVSQTRVWNRVALHHMAYKRLREQFPALGSQMVCNAIYAVSRISRSVYQHPSSPFNHAHVGPGLLPQLRFADSMPVYFDRHTLSLKAGTLSMFTLDGRMRFQLALGEHEEMAFHQRKLLEVVLSRNPQGVFGLRFQFAAADQPDPPEMESIQVPGTAVTGGIPEYVVVEEVA
jgi:hypothetical protein